MPVSDHLRLPTDTGKADRAPALVAVVDQVSAMRAAAPRGGRRGRGRLRRTQVQGSETAGAHQENRAHRGLDLRAFPGGPGDVRGGQPESCHLPGCRKGRRPAHGQDAAGGDGPCLRRHVVAAAEGDGDVLSVHEDVSERLEVGDPDVVAPGTGRAPDLGDDPFGRRARRVGRRRRGSSGRDCRAT